MRNVMLKGAAAVFAATIGVTAWAEDTTYQQSTDTDATGTEVRIQSDADATGEAGMSAEVQTPSTRPSEQTHLNDHPGETSVGGDGVIDRSDSSVDGSIDTDVDSTAADGTIGNDNMSDSDGMDTADHSGASLNDNPNDTTPSDDAGVDGEIRATSDLNGDGVIDSADNTVSGSLDPDVDGSIDADAQPAAGRMNDANYDASDDGASGPQQGASMGDNPNDSSPADDQVHQQEQPNETP